MKMESAECAKMRSLPSADTSSAQSTWKSCINLAEFFNFH